MCESEDYTHIVVTSIQEVPILIYESDVNPVKRDGLCELGGIHRIGSSVVGSAEGYICIADALERGCHRDNAEGRKASCSEELVL